MSSRLINPRHPELVSGSITEMLNLNWFQGLHDVITRKKNAYGNKRIIHSLCRKNY